MSDPDAQEKNAFYRGSSALRFGRYRVRYPSLVARPLTLFSNGQVIGHATGFLYKNGSRTFIVSNWHVFSGRDIHTGQPRHQTCAIPDCVAIDLHGALRTEEESVDVHTLRYPLHVENEQPLWLMHSHAQKVDVAVLPITMPNDPSIVAAFINVTLPHYPENGLHVASDVFIVGFPERFPLSMKLPIWKRGTVASEPLLVGEVGGKILVDAATRPGMSGSPVFFRRDDMTEIIDGQPARNPFDSEFVPCGIYSGRVSSSDEFAASIGIVWPLGFIQEIVDGTIRGAFVES